MKRIQYRVKKWVDIKSVKEVKVGDIVKFNYSRAKKTGYTTEFWHNKLSFELV